ncbi:MAG TPA: DUF485 domain-containing protein [Bacillota bacterium]|nr:DUF485 domain-containing protein [Bacillota bacterium]
MTKKPLDYSEIANSPQFKELLSKKKAFIVPMTIFFFVFYFTLPVMTSYSKVLNTPAIGSITWAWVFAFAQFIMTWTLCIIYTKKARGFDHMVDNIIEKSIKKGGN